MTRISSSALRSSASEGICLHRLHRERFPDMTNSKHPIKKPLTCRV
jgi:hypothetical protein